MNISFVMSVRSDAFAWAIKSLSKGSRWMSGRDLVISIQSEEMGTALIFAFIHINSSSGIVNEGSSLFNFCFIAISHKEIWL